MNDSLRSFVRRPLVRYFAGVIAVGLAFMLREVLSIAVDPGFSEYLLFYPTVMIVALLAGIWPALLATVVAAAAIVARGFLPLNDNLFVPRTTNYLNLVLFMVVCAFLTVVAGLYRRSREKAAAYDKELALRESQAAVRQQAELLKLSFDAIIVWRMGGWIESWNRGAEELYGFSESEALGRDIHELLHTSHEMSRPQFETLLRERRQWDGELRHLTREGRPVIASSRLHIGSGLDGTERVLQIDRDVTEQKRVQEELQRAHDELEEKVQQRTADLQKANRTLMMVSQCDQALVQVTDERELTAVICQIIQDEGDYRLAWVGLAESGDGEKLRCTASAGDFDGFLDGLRAQWGEDAMGSGPPGQAVRSGVPVVAELDAEASGELPWRDTALARGFRTMAAFPLLSARKTAFGALVIYSDRHGDFEKSQLTLLKELADDLAFGITSLQARVERDQAQHALELKAAQLQVLAGEIVRTEERERQRIAHLVHDQLQQLLAATLYRLESLRNAQTEAEHLESFTALSDQLRESIHISRSLTSEISHPALSEPDLTAALEWLAGWMMEKHGLKVEVQSAEALTVEMEEVRIMLLQAIRELLFNVVKHSGVKKAVVRLGTAADGRLLVTVSDEGVGFDVASIADPGSRSGGIGLLSMRERLALTGGGIEIESSPGHGSRFTVWVPTRFVKPAEERGSVKVPPEAGKPRGKRKGAAARPMPRGEGKIRILLVDDHTVVRNGIALQLRQQPDIEIVGEASDGETAVDLVRKLHPDVVTMDAHMPGMSGVETARAIHAEFPAVSIIGLSMFDEAKQVAAMREAGAVGYISKSASLESLLATIRSCAGS
jgi:PAS domain S-box-containing protein